MAEIKKAAAKKAATSKTAALKAAVKKEEAPKGRRAAPVDAPETPTTTRRAGTPAGTSSKYKVVSQ